MSDSEIIDLDCEEIQACSGGVSAWDVARAIAAGIAYLLTSNGSPQA